MTPLLYHIYILYTVHKQSLGRIKVLLYKQYLRFYF